VTSLIETQFDVVIKPNVGHPFKEETSVNTNPGLVAAVNQGTAKSQAEKRLFWLRPSARGCDTLECLEVSGIEAGAGGKRRTVAPGAWH